MENVEKLSNSKPSSYNPMTDRSVVPLLISMAVPPMISMLIQSLYNIVDSIFVAQISQNALTAVSLAFPLQNLSLSFGVGLGVAVNANIAINMGAGNMEKADCYAGQGIILTIVHSLLFVLIGLFGLRPFFSMFTNNPEVINYAIQYGSVVITLTFGSLFHILFEKYSSQMGTWLFQCFYKDLEQ